MLLSLLRPPFRKAVGVPTYGTVRDSESPPASALPSVPVLALAAHRSMS